MSEGKRFTVYDDFKERTNGELYIGVVGPVRTGKSTFVKRFMNQAVVPNIQDENVKARTVDELPQSSTGTTIMTTEPKFVPNEAVSVELAEDVSMKVRLIDCVGYVIPKAGGIYENDKERMVKTPWSDQEIPFTKAAEIGTRKVITDHSTVGIVVTADGTFGELKPDDFDVAVERTVKELKAINKPFIILVNSSTPYAESTYKYAEELENKYKVKSLPINCDQLKQEDIYTIMENLLDEFPMTKINAYIPKWLDVLPQSNPIKQEIISDMKLMLDKCSYIKDSYDLEKCQIDEPEYVSSVTVTNRSYADGSVDLTFEVDEKYYYETLSQLADMPVRNEYELINIIKEYSQMKNQYQKVSTALDSVKQKGYGIVTPPKEEIKIDEPELIHNGNRFGVKLRAVAPSIHFIKTDVCTEIAPLVGSEEQANDLIKFIKDNSQKEDTGIWDTNIFGKTIEQIVDDGIQAKLGNLSDETQIKMQDTLQKITNDSNKGVICIII